MRAMGKKYPLLTVNVHNDHAQRTNEIPFALLHADPRGERSDWLGAAREAIDGLLAGPRRVAAAGA